jgi:predicted exporter
VAVTVSLLVFGQIYLLTLVFGAALLGEAVDYSIQYLTARANAGAGWQAARGLRQVRPALLLALATSLLGYALLGLVPFPALRQMAVFAMSGMLAACLSVFGLLPALLQRPARPLSAPPVRWARAVQDAVGRCGRGRRGVLAALLLLLVALPGWWQLRHDDDVHLLIAPPAALQAQEATSSTWCRAPTPSRRCNARKRWRRACRRWWTATPCTAGSASPAWCPRSTASRPTTPCWRR